MLRQVSMASIDFASECAGGRAELGTSREAYCHLTISREVATNAESVLRVHLGSL
jgi:hypothetical protein